MIKKKIKIKTITLFVFAKKTKINIAQTNQGTDQEKKYIKELLELLSSAGIVTKAECPVSSQLQDFGADHQASAALPLNKNTEQLKSQRCCQTLKQNSKTVKVLLHL